MAAVRTARVVTPAPFPRWSRVAAAWLVALLVAGCGAAEFASPRWSYALRAHGAGGTPLVAGDDVFIVTRAEETGGAAGQLVSLDPRSGSPRWSSRVAETPLAATVERCGDLAVVRAGATLQAFDLADGAVRWQVRYDDPVVDVGCAGRAVFVALPGGIVDVRAARSGAHRRAIDMSPWTVASIETDARGALAVARREGDETWVGVFDLDRPSSAPLWQRQQGGRQGEVISDGSVRRLLGAGAWVAWDLRTGARQWEASTVPTPPDAAAAAWAGDVQVSLAFGEVVTVEAWDAAASRQLWTRSLRTSASSGRVERGPDGEVLVVLDDGAASYDVSSGAQRWRVYHGLQSADGGRCAVLGGPGGAPVARCSAATHDALVQPPYVTGEVVGRVAE